MSAAEPRSLPLNVDESVSLARQILPTLSAKAAYLSGAPLAGLGTPTSDVDLHVVYDGRQQPSNRQVVSGGRRIDVRYWTEESLANRINMCTRYDFTEDNTSQLDVIGRKTLDEAIRLAIGWVLLDDGFLQRLRAILEANASELMKLVNGVMAVEAQFLVEDAQGFIEMGSPEPAAYVSRDALVSAAESKLAFDGDLYLGRKWIWARWARTIDLKLGVDARDLVLDKGDRQESITQSLRRLWLCQDLLLQSSLRCSYPLETRLSHEDVRRDPYATPIPTMDAVLVYRSGRKAVRLSRQGALLWAVAHGRSAEDAIRLTAGMLRASGTDVHDQAVQDYYWDLVRFRLLGGPAGQR